MRYYEDRGLRAPYDGQKSVELGQEPSKMPEATSPGGDNEKQVAPDNGPKTPAEPSRALGHDVGVKSAIAETPVVKLGIVRGKQVDLRRAVAEHREGPDASEEADG